MKEGKEKERYHGNTRTRRKTTHSKTEKHPKNFFFFFFFFFFGKGWTENCFMILLDVFKKESTSFQKHPKKSSCSRRGYRLGEMAQKRIFTFWGLFWFVHDSFNQQFRCFFWGGFFGYPRELCV